MIASLVLALMAVTFLASCDDDDDCYVALPSHCANALVTVKTAGNGQCYLQLDDQTTVLPLNISQSPYGEKKVRALTALSFSDTQSDMYSRTAYVLWMDTILTKRALARPSLPADDTEVDVIYGNDPVDVLDSWLTVAEDGCLTLHFRTRWGKGAKAHFVNLLTGVDPEDPYVVEFRHNAYGDLNGRLDDGLVAFSLDDLPDTEGQTVKLTLRYESEDGMRERQFDYCTPRGGLHTGDEPQPVTNK